jgi:hypothetical protein
MNTNKHSSYALRNRRAAAWLSKILEHRRISAEKLAATANLSPVRRTIKGQHASFVTFQNIAKSLGIDLPRAVANAAWRSSLHGLSHSPEHKVWSNMKQRCLNPKNPDYPRYGGATTTIHPPRLHKEKGSSTSLQTWACDRASNTLFTHGEVRILRKRRRCMALPERMNLKRRNEITVLPLSSAPKTHQKESGKLLADPSCFADYSKQNGGRKLRYSHHPPIRNTVHEPSTAIREAIGGWLQ